MDIKKQVEKRFKRYNILYEDKIKKERILRQEKQVFFMYFDDELTRDDFKEPFFNDSQVISLSDGSFKFLTYCGKNQRDNIYKNALVLEKIQKHIYRVYLMDSDLNIRDFFIKFSPILSIKKHNYNLDPREYINKVREEYKKKEVIYIINQTVNKLVLMSNPNI